MRPEIQFILASIGLSVILTYAAWLKYRVRVFRQDLFHIRDEAWDYMLAQGELDSPEHREFRTGVNAIIFLAPMLNLAGLFRIWLMVDNQPPRERFPWERLSGHRDRVAERVYRYVLKETLSGRVFWLMVRTLRATSELHRSFARRVALLFDTRVFREYAENMEPANDLVEVCS